MNAVTTGCFAPGNRIIPIRDLVEFEKKIESSALDQPYPLAGESYLIDECFEHVPANMEHHQRQRWLYWAQPNTTAYRIKLFGFVMKQDKIGFDYTFPDKLFRTV